MPLQALRLAQQTTKNTICQRHNLSMAIRIISQAESITVPLQTPVVMIDEAEQFSIEIDGSTFTYSRITFPQMRRCDRMARSGNLVDDDKAMDLRLKACLKDWQGVEDGEGGELKYDPALLSFFPGAAKIRLDNALGQEIPECVTLPLGIVASVEVRRLTSAEHRAILAKHTQRGILDRFAAMEDMLAKAILSWQGFGALHDGVFVAIPYDPDVLKMTPQHAFLPIFDAIQSHTTQLDGELGN